MNSGRQGFRLAHISDTHIRNLKYHDDYRAVFERMYEILKVENPDYIVHCGDVAHTKTQLSPEFFEMAANFFDRLSDIAPLVLIAGNHDGNLKNSNRQDALTPIINALDKDSIHYLKNSGEFSPQCGLTFNVLSVFDRDNWVSPTDDDSINIALYHGAISGVQTDLGWVMDHGEDDISIFEGHDYAFLGDIHKTNQILDTEGRVRYCGSTIQQNHGETNDKGFLIWDIDSKDDFNVRHHILENPRPFVTVELTKTGRLPKKANVPLGSRLRIVTNHPIPVEKVRKAIDVAKTKFKPESVTFLNRSTGSRAKVNLSEDFKKYNLRDLAVQERLIKEYLKDYLSNTEEDKAIMQEVFQINRRVGSQAEQGEKTHRNINWSLKTLEWNNLFNYGEGNKVDFNSLGGLVGIFGKNFTGKSSIVDSLLWVMYNTTSKRNRKSYDIVNQNSQSAWGKVVIQVDEKELTIERSAEKYLKRLKGEETEEVKTSVDFSVYDSVLDENKSLNGETRSQTDDNIRKFFGTIDDFLMTSLSSQLESLAFISEGSTKRKEILAKFLDLDIFESKYKIAKDESSMLEGKIKHLEGESGEDGYREEIDNAAAQVAECEKSLEVQESECASLNSEVQALSKEITKIETRLESTPSQKFINVEEMKAKVQSYKDNIGIINTRNISLEESISATESIVQKIDTFLEDFNFTSWKNKKQEVVDLRAEIKELESLLASASNDRKSLYHNKVLLEQVPCGSEYSHCKFIRSAYEKISNEANVESRFAELSGEIKDAMQRVMDMEPDVIDKYLSQHEELVSKRREKKEEISNSELEIAKNKTTLVTLRDSLTRAEEEIRIFEENEKVIREFASLTNDRNSLVKKHLTKRQELERCKKKIAELNRLKGVEQNNFLNLTRSLAELKIARKDYSAYDLYKKAMGSNGVSLDIIKRELPSINEEIAKILTNVVDFEVYLENDERRLNVLIKHPKFEPRPLEMGSGAEKSIAAMAIRLAFINVSSMPIGDIFILDEPGTSLDEENMEGFIRILDLVKSQFKNVVLISHLESLKDSVDLQISIEKKGKFAFVNQ